MSETRREHDGRRVLSRREILGGAAAAGLGLTGLAALLAGCGGSGGESAEAEATFVSTTATATSGEESAATGVEAAGEPKQGGDLRVGMVGGGPSENFNPLTSVANVIGYTRLSQVFNRLTKLSPTLEVEPELATEWSANADSTAWEFKLRPDVLFHDGKPLTTDDVIFSLKTYIAAELPFLAQVAPDGITAPDRQTILIALDSPNTLFPQVLASSVCVIVQDAATDFTHPIGTGPFKFVSLAPGQRSVCERNPDYWDAPRPYVDTLEIISIDDDTARLNALLAGEINVMAQLPFTQARRYEDSEEIQLLRAPSVVPYCFYMAVDVPPFDNLAVRQALKLIPDRQALIDVALNGYGEIANDLFGKGLSYYAESIPQRTQDIEQARSLLQQAGHDDLEITLDTAPVVPGFVEAANLFAQQAKEAGVTVNVRNNPAAAYWDTSQLYLKQAFAQTQWNVASLAEFYNYSLAPNALLNETHWKDAEASRLLAEAISAPNEETAAERWLEVQQIQWDQGGYIMYANIDIIDAAAPNVMGITPSRVAVLGDPVGLSSAWIA